MIPKLTVADVEKAKFGDLPLFQSQKEYKISPKTEDFVSLKTASAEEPREVHVRAYLQSTRVTGKTVFAVLRQKVDTLQCVGFGDRDLARYVASVPKESCVEVVGTVKKTPQPISSCSIIDRELEITRFFAVTRAQAQLPLQVEDASRPDSAFAANTAFVRPGRDTRLDNRVLDLRTPANVAIFRVRAAIQQEF